MVCMRTWVREDITNIPYSRFLFVRFNLQGFRYRIQILVGQGITNAPVTFQHTMHRRLRQLPRRLNKFLLFLDGTGRCANHQFRGQSLLDRNRVVVHDAQHRLDRQPSHLFLVLSHMGKQVPLTDI